MRAPSALVVVAVTLLIWLGFSAYLVQKHASQLAGAAQESRNLTQAVEGNIHRTVEAIDTTIRAVRIARARDPSHFDLAAWERESGLTRDLTLQISLTDRNGTVIGSNIDPLAGSSANVADRPHFRAPRDVTDDILFI